MIKSIIKKQSPCYFISPHLDDAVFSVGAYMLRLKQAGVPMTVINVMTSAGDGQSNLSAKAFLRQIGAKDPHTLFKTRIREDQKSLRQLGIKPLNLGYVDALWRKFYPTYRWHIISGRIASGDQVTIANLAKRLKRLIKDPNAMVFCPVGYGNHVDHLVVREAVRLAFPSEQIIYWLDFPYSVRDTKALPWIGQHNLTSESYRGNLSAKLKLAKLYTTQYSAVVGSDDVLLSTPETLYYESQSPVAPPLTLVDHCRAFMLAPKDYLYCLLFPPRGVVHSTPYRHSATKAANSIMRQIHRIGQGAKPELIGSTGLKILGTGDLDILVPVAKSAWDGLIPALVNLYGQPFHRSREMVQWKFIYQGHAVDLDLIDPASTRYAIQRHVYDLLSRDLATRTAYIKLKKMCEGQSKRDYTIRLSIFFETQLKARQNYYLMPSKIKGYSYLKPLNLGRSGMSYLALYQNSGGKQAVVKLWQGKVKNRGYHFLRNELRAYQTIVNGKGFIVPRLLATYESKNLLYLMTSYAKGQTIENSSAETKVRVFSAILSQLHAQPLPHSSRLMRRLPIYWAIISPYLALRALIIHPALWRLIATSFIHLTKGIPALLGRRELTLTYRDLSDVNVYKYSQQVTLIDLQLVCVADPLLDFAVVFLKYGLDKDFIAQFRHSPAFRARVSSHRSRIALDTYTTILALYDLGLHNGNYAQAVNYLTMSSSDL